MNKGDTERSPQEKTGEYTALVKYFLAALAVRDTDQWVNLSPYERDRIISDNFGLTEMGRDVLAQDYLLKQLAASLTSPDTTLGQAFWARVYDTAAQEGKDAEAVSDLVSKVWIVPDRAEVFEHENTVCILSSRLRVMTAGDYEALAHGVTVSGRSGEENEAALASFRELILPVIETEVNEGEHFALLRQMYSGMILATWYKQRLKDTVLGQGFADRGKLAGLRQDPAVNAVIYDRYLEAFRRGAYNLIREDVDRLSQEVIPRKYFSGGFQRAARGEAAQVVVTSGAMTPGQVREAAQAAQDLRRGFVDKVSTFFRGAGKKTVLAGMLALMTVSTSAFGFSFNADGTGGTIEPGDTATRIVQLASARGISINLPGLQQLNPGIKNINKIRAGDDLTLQAQASSGVSAGSFAGASLMSAGDSSPAAGPQFLSGVPAGSGLPDLTLPGVMLPAAASLEEGGFPGAADIAPELLRLGPEPVNGISVSAPLGSIAAGPFRVGLSVLGGRLPESETGSIGGEYWGMKLRVENDQQGNVPASIAITGVKISDWIYGSGYGRIGYRFGGRGFQGMAGVYGYAEGWGGVGSAGGFNDVNTFEVGPYSITGTGNFSGGAILAAAGSKPAGVLPAGILSGSITVSWVPTYDLLSHSDGGGFLSAMKFQPGVTVAGQFNPLTGEMFRLEGTDGPGGKEVSGVYARKLNGVVVTYSGRHRFSSMPVVAAATMVGLGVKGSVPYARGTLTLEGNVGVEKSGSGSPSWAGGLSLKWEEKVPNSRKPVGSMGYTTTYSHDLPAKTREEKWGYGYWYLALRNSPDYNTFNNTFAGNRFISSPEDLVYAVSSFYREASRLYNEDDPVGLAYTSKAAGENALYGALRNSIVYGNSKPVGQCYVWAQYFRQQVEDLGRVTGVPVNAYVVSVVNKVKVGVVPHDEVLVQASRDKWMFLDWGTTVTYEGVKTAIEAVEARQRDKGVDGDIYTVLGADGRILYQKASPLTQTLRALFLGFSSVDARARFDFEGGVLGGLRPYTEEPAGTRYFSAWYEQQRAGEGSLTPSAPDSPGKSVSAGGPPLPGQGGKTGLVSPQGSTGLTEGGRLPSAILLPKETVPPPVPAPAIVPAAPAVPPVPAVVTGNANPGPEAPWFTPVARKSAAPVSAAPSGNAPTSKTEVLPWLLRGDSAEKGPADDAAQLRGGIDFAASHLDLVIRQGVGGALLPFADAALMEMVTFDGLTPDILDISPFSGGLFLSALLGAALQKTA